ncbi:MAG: glycosyltransferase [Gemmatimonadota bacterium]|nr:MAG: glycosyltransferase [Gemmatimonadota bacterium]
MSASEPVARHGPPPQPLIIAGPAGTLDQVVIDALAANGIGIAGSGGQRCRPPGPDAGFGTLHDELFRPAGGPWPAGEQLSRPPVSPAQRERAAAILAGPPERDGWPLLADPRAPLLMELWEEIAPEARWIFVFSRPALFAWTLIAGGELDHVAASPIRQATAAFRIWQSLALRITEFARSRPERCLCLRAPEDFDLPGTHRISTTLSGWGFAVDSVDLPGRFSPHAHITRAPAWIYRIERLSRATRDAHDSLLEVVRQLARTPHSPARPRPRPPTPTPVPRSSQRLCIAGWNRTAYSQTFIRAHIERLSAHPVLLLPDRRDRGRFLTVDEFRIGSVLDRALLAGAREFRTHVEAMESRPLGRFLKRQGAEAVLAEFGPNGVRVARACRAAGVPLIVHFHGFDVYREGTLRAYGDRYRSLFKSAAAIVAVSSHMERRLVELGAPRAKVHCNPCGVDVSLFDQAEPALAPPRFLSVGRFVNKKGPLLTILAFSRALEEAPDARLIMVGDGPLWEGAQRLATALGLEHRISFPGSCSHREVMQLMQSARAFVQHSVVAYDEDSEGTPVAVLEAGASGLPVVGTRHAGIADAVLHDETGLLVEEGDVEGMASYMLRVARDPPAAGALGRRAREHVARHYSMDLHIARLQAIIDEAIRRHRAGTAVSPSGADRT